MTIVRNIPERVLNGLRHESNFLFIFALLVVSCVFIYPDAELILLEHWQHLPLDKLNENFWDEIINLHSQVPLWNMTIGAITNICDAEVACTSSAIHFLFIAITLAVALMLAAIAMQSGASRVLSGTAATVYILLPSTVYYENYPFYPHLIMFLCAAAAYSAFIWHRNNSNWGYGFFLISMVALS